MNTVQAFCSRVLSLEVSRMRAQSASRQIVNSYLFESTVAALERVWPSRETAPYNENVRNHSLRARAVGDVGTGHFDFDTPVELGFECWNLVGAAEPNLSLQVINELGRISFKTLTLREHGRPFHADLFSSSCTIPGRLLDDGP